MSKLWEQVGKHYFSAQFAKRMDCEYAEDNIQWGFTTAQTLDCRDNHQFV